jgi:hypothetical protein
MLTATEPVRIRSAALEANVLEHAARWNILFPVHSRCFRIRTNPALLIPITQAELEGPPAATKTFLALQNNDFSGR